MSSLTDDDDDLVFELVDDDELTDEAAEEIMVAALNVNRIMHVLANDRGLRTYWTRGAGAAKIRWGTDGSFSRCVRLLGKHVTRPQGLCAEYHKEATGEWPAEKGVESSMSHPLVAHGSHNQQDHNPHKGSKVSDTDPGTAQRFAENRNPGKKIHIMRVAESDIQREDGETVFEALEDFEPFLEVTKRGRSYEIRSSRENLEAVKKAHNLNIHSISVDDSLTADDNPIDRDDDEEDNLARQIRQLEEQLEGDEGLNDEERRRLEQLRRAADDDYDGGDFTLHPLIAAARKKKKEDDAANTYADEPWEGVLSVEGIESGDGRIFSYGSLDFAAPPMPLMYQPANVGGHNASIVAGEIQKAYRKGNEIFGTGVIYGNVLNGEHGDGVRNMMATGGVSVDVDDVKDADVEMVFADGDEGGFMAKPEMTVFHRGRIRGATLVAFPAFVEAKLAFTNQVTTAAADSCGCQDQDVLIAAGHTITIPDAPPRHWFSEPTDVKTYGALTITDEGRVFGWLAPADTTHRSVRRKVPMGAKVDYSRWMNKETITADGGRVVTGVITGDCGHADTQNYGTLANRKEHYDNSCSIFANVAMGEKPGKGVWFAGALRHGVTAPQVAAAMGCSLSGDWQPHPDRPGVQEFIAALLVPVPGFPMARTKASVEFNDGVITASVVPVRFGAEEPPSTEELAFAAIQRAKDIIVASMGLDPATRKADIMAELEGV